MSKAQLAILTRLAAGDVVMLQGRFWVWAKFPGTAYPRPNAVSGSAFKILRTQGHIKEIDPRRNVWVKRMYEISESGRAVVASSQTTEVQP